MVVNAYFMFYLIFVTLKVKAYQRRTFSSATQQNFIFSLARRMHARRHCAAVGYQTSDRPPEHSTAAQRLHCDNDMMKFC